MQIPKDDLYPKKDDLPIVTGPSGLTGRPMVRPIVTDLEQPIDVVADGEPVYAQPSASGPTIPSTCLRALHAFRPDCPFDCPGRQEDGGCLADIVREANERGVAWKFEIDERTGFWVYAGDFWARTD
jgi:hypothetical protein